MRRHIETGTTLLIAEFPFAVDNNFGSLDQTNKQQNRKGIQKALNVDHALHRPTWESQQECTYCCIGEQSKEPMNANNVDPSDVQQSGIGQPC